MNPLPATVAATLIVALASGLNAQDSATARMMVRVDTSRFRIAKPISRVMVEAAWSVADTTPPATNAVIRRPAWTGNRVLARRLARPGEPVTLRVAARRLPPPNGRNPTPYEDTTLQSQRSADFRVRSEALARIRPRAAGPVHPSVAVNLINELDSVGAARTTGTGAAGQGDDPNPEDEAYGEYVVSLARTVVRLNDPRAIRAVAFGGLHASRDAQRFVASQGVAGLAALDTVFAASEALASSVVTTWALALGNQSGQLDFADSVYLYTRIVASGHQHPIPFAHAVRIARLIDLEPELDSVAARVADSSPAAAATARVAARAVAALASSATASDWLVRLRLRAGSLCIDESRIGSARCGRIIGALEEAARASAAAGAGAGPASVRSGLARVVQELDSSVTEGRLAAETRGRLIDLVNRSGGGARFNRAILVKRAPLRPAAARTPPA